MRAAGKPNAHTTNPHSACTAANDPQTKIPITHPRHPKGSHCTLLAGPRIQMAGLGLVCRWGISPHETAFNFTNHWLGRQLLIVLTVEGKAVWNKGSIIVKEQNAS